MLPNRFPDSGEAPEYNSVDSTLWYFEAVRAYLKYSGDLDFVRENLYEVLADIVAWHERGTRYGIRWMRTVFGRRRSGHATDVDGRQGERARGDAAQWKAGGDPGAMVQRAARDGRLGAPTRPPVRRRSL